MHTYIEIGNYVLPSYGLCIVLGVLTANLIALFLVKREQMDSNDFIILEAYAFLGAFIGAKGLYLFISRKTIDWSRMWEPEYFNQMMRGGFVFYGGLILGLLFVLMAGKIHKIPAGQYMEKCIFLVPWIHGFGRIGCFMAGCCYGIPYDGAISVVFPEGSLAPAGIRLFPVQLVEAIGLLMIAVLLFFLQYHRAWRYSIETYLMLYAILRFVLEYYRYDACRGRWLFFTTSQWISVALAVFAACSVLYRRRKNKNACK